MTHLPLDTHDMPPFNLAADASIAQLRQRVVDLEAAVTLLVADAGRVAAAGRRAADLQPTVDALTARASQLPALQQTVSTIAAAVPALESHPPVSGTVEPPPMQDVRSRLPVHATNRYASRNVGEIGRVVVHHTVTRGDILPERIAQVQVAQGKAGITYHFLITADGTIYWTQALETVVEQMLDPAANRQSVGVALAGNFTDQAPPAPQLNSAAALIAWLVNSQHLTIAAVVGRKEIETAHGSPGKQWTQGASYRVTLMQLVQAILDAAGEPGPGDTDVQRLQVRVRELEATVASLRPLADQAIQLGQEVQSLRGTLSQRDEALARLQADVAALNTAIGQREAEIRQLRDEIARLKGTPGGGPSAPVIRNMVDQLEKHPSLPPYPARTKPISMIVIHHTDTPKTFTPQQIAHYHVFGERKNAQGKVIKEQWPGIGYHFLVGADGTIYQCQREETKSNHVGGEPNNFSVAVSFLGRFMKTNLQGQPAPSEDQLPTTPQLRGAAHLVAWLMQKYNIPLDKVMGHRDVWVGATACPGDQWLTGAKWKGMLQAAVRTALEGTPAGGDKLLEHYVLFWDHGSDWARDDYRNAQDYIAHFRPTNGFSVEEALVAQHVTIVGGELGVNAADEARLRAAGCMVHRLAGADEADTRAKLAALIASNTPWPGAPPSGPTGLLAPDQFAEEAVDNAPITDEWTVPEDWWDIDTGLTWPGPALSETGTAGETWPVADTSPWVELASILVPGAEEVVAVDVPAAEAAVVTLPAVVETLESTVPWNPSEMAESSAAAETPDLPPTAAVAALGSGMKARQQERARKAKK